MNNNVKCIYTMQHKLLNTDSFYKRTGNLNNHLNLSVFNNTCFTYVIFYYEDKEEKLNI